MNAQEKRLRAGAEAYAKADPSDPWALTRAMAHIRNGIAGLTADGEEAIYSATAVTVMRRLPSGDEYPAVVWTNRKRP